MNSKNKRLIRTMATLAILIALTIVFSFISIPVITGTVAFTVTFLVVTIGAILFGPWAGLILGLTMGLMSFGIAFSDAFGNMLLDINVGLTFVVLVPTRAIMGLLVGLIYKAFRVKLNSGVRFHVAHLVTNLIAPLLNTTFFIGALVGCFYHTALLQDMINQQGNLFLFILVVFGLNFLAEFIIAGTIGYVSSSRLVPQLTKFIDINNNIKTK